VTGVTAPDLAEAHNVTRRFGDFVAVDGVDLALEAGEVVGLLGANGAGKTTLIRLLLGLLRPSEGSVALFGEPPSRRTRRRLGYVPQTLGLYDDLTPRENLQFGRSVFGRGGELPQALRPSADVPVGQLPLGVQRRVAFAQALGHRPDLLVLDEPTSGVDALARARLWESVRAAAEGGAGALVTTHGMDEADECDRLVIMAAGRVVASGTAADIVGSTTVVVVDTDRWAEAFAAVDAAGLAAALVGRALRVPGASVSDVERALGDVPARVDERPATLEERFFELSADGAAGGGPR
jgi:ABC-2 type transport system ATP-binding protein/ribosome-dependent ATPase